jgi:hypothetical protein
MYYDYLASANFGGIGNLHGVITPDQLDMARLGLAALIFGIVMAVAPRPVLFKLHGALFGLAMAAALYTHQWHLAYVGMAYGLVTSLVLFPFRPKGRRA